MTDHNITDWHGNPGGYDQVISLLQRVCRRRAKAAAPKRTVLLSKSMALQTAIKPAAPALSREQLTTLVNQAVTGGLLSGHDGMAALELLKQGKQLPQGLRIALGG